MTGISVSEEQAQIVNGIGVFLSTELPADRFRPANRNKVRRESDLWVAMAELGWFGLGISQDQGGVGYGLMEEILLFRECGRFLVSPTVIASVMGAHVALASGNKDVAAAIIQGKTRVAPGLSIDSVVPDAGQSQMAYVFDSAGCDLILTWTDTGIVLLDRSDANGGDEQPCFDETIHSREAELSLGNAIGGDTQALFSRSMLLLSSQLCGMAEASRDLAVEYAKVREQFGRPIGSFQAVKHRCADMAVRAEVVWAQTVSAASALDSARPDAPLQVEAAKLLAGDAAHENGHSCIQVLGGIGFQAEADAHLFLKRSRLYNQMGRNRMQHTAEILKGALFW